MNGEERGGNEPYASREAELAVLSAYFHSPVERERIRTIATGADFYWPHHEAIWDAMQRLVSNGKPVGAATVPAMLQANRVALGALPDIFTTWTAQGEGESAASIVRGHAIRRRTINELKRSMQEVSNPACNAEGFLAGLATKFATLRDSGVNPDLTAKTVSELLAVEDEPYDWLIPDLLERGDRFMLTGVEGMGKSVLLRQIVMAAAAGIDPFGHGSIDPVKGLIIDVENTERQVRRAMRSLTASMRGRGVRDAADHVEVDCIKRIDITKDLSLARIHATLDAVKPDIVVIGPMYRLTPRAIQTDDEAAPLLAALDTIKERGIALLIEAHAGHDRATMRPRGSSAFLGWPEFGYGLRPSEREGLFDLVRWRGDRDERRWPQELERGGALPWSSSEQQKVTWGAQVDRQRKTDQHTSQNDNPWETHR